MAVRALVTGASGFVGSGLVPALLTAGVEVVAAGRDPDRLRAFEWSDQVTCVELDVTDVGSCARAFAEVGPIDVVYYLVHALGTVGFVDSDRAAADHLGEAAYDAGVGRIVYLGGLVPSGETLSDHLDSRAEVGEQLQRSGVDVVWLRAAIIVGAGSVPYEFIRQLVGRLPLIPLPSWMDQRVQPIAMADVLRYLVACADPGRVPSGVFDIAGHEQLSYSDLVRRYARVTGLRRAYLPLHGLTPAAAAPLVARLTSIPTPLMEDLVLSMANTMVSEDDRIESLVLEPGEELLDLDAALARAAQDVPTATGAPVA